MPGKRNVNSIIGTVACGWVAVSLSLLFWKRSWSSTIPLWFLIVIAAVALRYGFKSAFLGTLFAAVIFFAFLLSPLGAANDSGSSNLLYMILGGTAISYVLSASSLVEPKTNYRSRRAPPKAAARKRRDTSQIQKRGI